MIEDKIINVSSQRQSDPLRLTFKLGEPQPFDHFCFHCHRYVSTSEILKNKTFSVCTSCTRLRCQSCEYRACCNYRNASSFPLRIEGVLNSQLKQTVIEENLLDPRYEPLFATNYPHYSNFVASPLHPTALLVQKWSCVAEFAFALKQIAHNLCIYPYEKALYPMLRSYQDKIEGLTKKLVKINACPCCLGDETKYTNCCSHPIVSVVQQTAGRIKTSQPAVILKRITEDRVLIQYLGDRITENKRRIYSDKVQVSIADLKAYDHYEYYKDQYHPSIIQAVKKKFYEGYSAEFWVPIYNNEDSYKILWNKDLPWFQKEKVEKKCAQCGKTDVKFTCSACFKVSYCDEKCQKKNWPVHYLECLIEMDLDKMQIEQKQPQTLQNLKEKMNPEVEVVEKVKVKQEYIEEVKVEPVTDSQPMDISDEVPISKHEKNTPQSKKIKKENDGEKKNGFVVDYIDERRNKNTRITKKEKQNRKTDIFEETNLPIEVPIEAPKCLKCDICLDLNDPETGPFPSTDGSTINACRNCISIFNSRHDARNSVSLKTSKTNKKWTCDRVLMAQPPCYITNLQVGEKRQVKLFCRYCQLKICFDSGMRDSRIPKDFCSFFHGLVEEITDVKIKQELITENQVQFVASQHNFESRLPPKEGKMCRGCRRTISNMTLDFRVTSCEDCNKIFRQRYFFKKTKAKCHKQDAKGKKSCFRNMMGLIEDCEDAINYYLFEKLCPFCQLRVCFIGGFRGSENLTFEQFFIPKSSGCAVCSDPLLTPDNKFSISTCQTCFKFFDRRINGIPNLKNFSTVCKSTTDCRDHRKVLDDKKIPSDIRQRTIKRLCDFCRLVRCFHSGMKTADMPNASYFFAKLTEYHGGNSQKLPPPAKPVPQPQRPSIAILKKTQKNIAKIHIFDKKCSF